MVPLCKQLNFSLALLFVTMISAAGRASDVSFQRNYKIIWGNQHVFFPDHGREVQLSIDRISGAGFRSNIDYASGFFQMRIKIPNKDSRGVVTAFYLSSNAENGQGGSRDELDFEFLGNNIQPYILQTNVFTMDDGGREQRINLWFDPTIDFHSYGILWNQHQIVFYVDNTPIRVIENQPNGGIRFPSQPMHIIASIWDGEPWASNGKSIDWNQAPFTAHFQGFTINGCPSIDKACYSPNLWWNSHKYWELNAQERRAFEEVKRKYLIYDYCSDRGRLHSECRIM